MPDTEVVGRDEELRTISSFVQRFPPSGALLIEGDAGIGKTTLWRAGVEASRELSYCVLRASPAEKEETFSYSVVSDLLADVLDDVLPGLPPAPTTRARDRAPPTRLRRAASLSGTPWGSPCSPCCCTLAASKPVVVAVDDVQWLDRSSAAMLAFAGRRLRKEQVALLLARRQSSKLDSERIEEAIAEDRRVEVRVGPLSMGALHRLLRERLGTTLARPSLRRVHEASGGNPFYAVELVRALEARAAGSDRPSLPVPDTLEEILHERIDALPPPVRSPRRGGGAEAADRVHARKLACAGAGVGGGLDRAHERRGQASRTRCSLRPPTARSPLRSGGVCTAGSPKSSLIRRSGPGTWHWS